MMSNFSWAGLVSLASQMSTDFEYFVREEKLIPEHLSYSISNSEDSAISASARTAALTKFRPLIKHAFDTRRMDQDSERNPRANLQYWHRTDSFIVKEDQEKLEILAKLMDPLNEIKTKFGAQPEYLQSYARVLQETLARTLKIKENDKDIFGPQVNYLEQLIFARYRLSLDEIEKCSSKELKERLMSKDEDLLKRGKFLPTEQFESHGQEKNIAKDGNYQVLNDTLAQAIFGQSFRKPGENSAVRTITISIRDSVEE